MNRAVQYLSISIACQIEKIKDKNMADSISQMKVKRKKTSILFLIPILSIGGAERQLVILAAGLKRLGYAVKVAVFSGGGALESDLRREKVPIVNLGKSSRWNMPFHYFHLIGLLRQEHPKVLFSYMSLANDWSILVKPWVPATRIIWGVRVSELNLNDYDWQGRLTYHLEAKLARFANQIICNSYEGLSVAVKRGFSSNKIIVIPNGINVDYFRPLRTHREQFRRECGIKKTEKLIGLIARLNPMKDHSTFLQAAGLLARERNDVRFVCVGSGPKSYEAKLRKLAADLGLDNILIWIGSRHDMQFVYNGLDVLTLSSSYGEGFANVIGEAMACGVPCVVTDVGDSALIVDDLGEVVPARDPVELKNGMIRILRRIDKEKRMLSEDNRRRIANEFSVDTMINRTVDVLEQNI
jgi:glycosyltransferase involved in cell wall biosynthesis